MARLKMLPSRLPMANLSRLSKQPKAADPVYNDREWRALASRIKRERGHRCERCSKTEGRIYADHIIELKDGGALMDPKNVQLLCASCHTTKTNEARAARMAARAHQTRR